MFFAGLDLGKSHDYTALSIVQPAPPQLHVVHLHRYPLGTAYTVIASDLASTLARQPLTGATVLGVDATGLGGPFLDLLREKVTTTPIVAITLTGAGRAKWTGQGTARIPKAELARTLQRLVSANRLRMAKGLKEGPVLFEELRRFQVRIDRSGHATYAADFGSGENDDLALSLSYACWLAENLSQRTLSQPV